MTTPLHHPDEALSNAVRAELATLEPRCLRTYTPTQAVLARSSGVFHWTPEGRRLYDFTSGVLVSNLGHNPCEWLRRFTARMGWTCEAASSGDESSAGYSPALPMTSYNAVTPVEIDATRRLLTT